jgi:hypothetical protein
MVQHKAEIGKYALESLTTGMYENHLVIYREYIQNSADAIDNAVKQGIIKRENALIDIIVDKDNNYIEVRDNGLGIKTKEAYSKLINVGKSDKVYEENRGFRGIGRLAGFAYCEKLIFETTSYGEEEKSIIVFDCKLMRELLIPDKHMDLSATDVLERVTSEIKDKEEKNLHYFKVKMIGINNNEDKLLKIERVYSYLSQVAPVPFNKAKFIFKSKIIEHFQSHDVPLIEYKVSIGKSYDELRPIYKPHKGRFKLYSKSNKQEKSDEILDIIPIYKEVHGEQIYIGWYSKSNLLGACSEVELKGIRLRKDNIQIGDNTTISELFKDDRFNSWYIGEIHIIDSGVIPNARRDNFELNDEYIKIRESLAELFNELYSQVRVTSQTRNSKINKVKRTLGSVEKEVKKLVQDGATSQFAKDKVTEKLKKAEVDLKKEKPKTEEQVQEYDQQQQRITNLIKELESKVSYRELIIPSSYSRKEKKIVQFIFEVLDESGVLDHKNLQLLKDQILKKLNNN